MTLGKFVLSTHFIKLVQNLYQNIRKGIIMKDKIQEVLSEIRVALQQDGGDIDLVGVDEQTGIVRVELQGRCRG